LAYSGGNLTTPSSIAPPGSDFLSFCDGRGSGGRARRRA
jgi:hypothetical protein